ncbi:MAG: bifunctional phosphoribosyl-AMP cyclohydrolase/phosphoribosyl-ATP diphosphatase HisIE [Vicinamibacteria bacterium]
MADIEGLRFDAEGLIPAVVQDDDGGAVLMVAYMSRESLLNTIATGEAHFWSRSRKAIWRKGETSGNVLRVTSIVADCDLDCLLIRAEPAGPACHTGERSCFFDRLAGETPEAELFDVLGTLFRTIRERFHSRPEGSYTAELFARGTPRIAQKVGEEATEVVIAATERDTRALAEESADLLYHLLVLWKSLGLEPGAVAEALARRVK